MKNSNKKQRTSYQDGLEKRRVELLQQRDRLPVNLGKKTILEEVHKNKCIIVMGETGSGKTTQIPQFLFENGYCQKGIIGITQPRRVAAISVATRVAEEMGVKLGEEVGYNIRFEDKTSKKTVLKYMTDGMLLREAMIDSMLSRYSVLIIDEAHERTVDTDMLLGILNTIVNKRSNLKLIIMSATLDADLFANFFKAKVLYVEGRQFPVKIMYTTEPQTDYFESTLITILQIHLEEQPGDILVFLTGREEIVHMQKLLIEKSQQFPTSALELIICPIYAALPSEEQIKAFAITPPKSRKVILATNIAETSITISGIRYVVDAGVVKARSYNPKTGIETLMVIPISKAASRQRSGRAGREAPGVCFRLYKEDDFYKLRENPIPEIKRCNLASEIIQMKAIGIKDIVNFNYIEKPSMEGIKKALEELYIIGALNEEGDLSEIGIDMAKLPLAPSYAKSLIASKELRCTQEITQIISMLSVESDSIFYTPKGKKKEAEAAKKKFISYEGDHLMLLNIYKSFMSNGQSKEWCFENFINIRSILKAKNIYEQLKTYLTSMNIPLSSSSSDTDAIRKCFVAGFFRNVVALQPDGTYRTIVDNKTVQVHPSSVLHGKKMPFVLYNELVQTSKLYIRDCMAISNIWLSELIPSTTSN